MPTLMHELIASSGQPVICPPVSERVYSHSGRRVCRLPVARALIASTQSQVSRPAPPPATHPPDDRAALAGQIHLWHRELPAKLHRHPCLSFHTELISSQHII